jgi:hypothetical protein
VKGAQALALASFLVDKDHTYEDFTQQTYTIHKGLMIWRPSALFTGTSTNPDSACDGDNSMAHVVAALIAGGGARDASGWRCVFPLMIAFILNENGCTVLLALWVHH